MGARLGARAVIVGKVGDDEHGVDHTDFLPGQVDGGGDTKDETSL